MQNHEQEKRLGNITIAPGVSEGVGGVAGASALALAAMPAVHAAGSDLIQVALIGCGGRGGGAAVNALSTKSGPIKLVAMADAYRGPPQEQLQQPQRLSSSQNRWTCRRSGRFIGFDAYKKAMDCLKPGDVAIFTTPLAFRWVHFTYAIEKGLNVFMEKPVTVDGPTSKRMLKLAEDPRPRTSRSASG